MLGEIGGIVRGDRLGASRRSASDDKLATSRGCLHRKPLHIDAVKDFLGQLLRRRRWAGETESLDRRLGAADLVVKPHLAMGGEPRHVEHAHREEHKSDCNREHPRREAETVQRQRKSWRARAACEHFQRATRPRRGLRFGPEDLTSCGHASAPALTFICALIMAEKLAPERILGFSLASDRNEAPRLRHRRLLRRPGVAD